MVIAERCIACGNCIKVCSQNAKKIKDGTEHTLELLNSDNFVIAIVAPSFPAAFDGIKPLQIVTGLKKLGFDEVHEVAFGADMVGQAYTSLTQKETMPLIITSPCPAVVNYIEKYHSELLLLLAPIVSPMIALGRIIKQKYKPDAKIVFIGPCIAKKQEIEDPRVKNVIDEVLTFDELQTLFAKNEIELSKLKNSEPDGPHPSIGRIFAVSGGLLKTAAMQGDVLENDIIVTEGIDRAVDVLQKASEGEIEATFLDVLFCKGCINGPQMTNNLSVFVRKDKVVNYLKSQMNDKNQAQAAKDRRLYKDVSMKRGFTNRTLDLPVPSEEIIQDILKQTGKYTKEDELNCGACGYLTCKEKAIAVYQGLAEAQMCLPYMLSKLEKIQDELTDSNTELRSLVEKLRKTQNQLVQSEKLASVGQLAAGVAHELNNPLGGILLFVSMLLEKEKNDSESYNDLKKILQETERSREIVKGLLEFSRQAKIVAAVTDLNKILECTLSLLKHHVKFQNIKVEKNLYPLLPRVFSDVGQIQQVFLNIILNAIDAMQGHGILTITTQMAAEPDYVTASIQDTGPGIKANVLHKIFDPFFTTKEQGKGTGLGLAIAYGIIKKHKGDILVETLENKGATFIIKLPTAELYKKLNGENDNSGMFQDIELKTSK